MTTHREIVKATLNYKSAIEYLQGNNYIPQKFWCQTCSQNMKIEMNNNIFRWRCSKCNKRKSLLSNTILFNSNLDLPLLIDLIYFWSLNLTQNYTLNEISSKSRDTITRWYHTLSLQSFFIMRNLSRVKIGGVGCTIEVDESKFSKRKFNVGRVVRSPWVIGGVDIFTGEFFLRSFI
ncbi:hypothetical protein H312_02374 [Anncaliia algerae PRA339]|uniref:ISXO2-like transposase domain-containing protein n=1 Tax=Anncaliia algerae PRA339 TaxID=1288291 RepID=A0A059EZQ7_9MICR|nr:hypothetical protein H312_02374 [Anncaliia algerae PRA339]